MIPPIARRFVAGETPPEAIDRTRELTEQDVGAICNLLGEHYTDPAQAADDREVYRRLAGDLADPDLRGCISVKPSQLGLDVGEDTFHENVRLVAEAATDAGIRTWVDMEDHTTTDATLDAVEALADDGHDVGVCLQANLRRTPADLERFAGRPVAVRLVKGAYDEPEHLAYADGRQVNEAYRDLIETAFETYDGGVAVGTHDEAMIEHAIACHDEYGTPFEFQLLAGVREDRQRELAEEYDVWQYVPFGDRWASYFYRRVLERKENALFALRAVVGR